MCDRTNANYSKICPCSAHQYRCTTACPTSVVFGIQTNTAKVKDLCACTLSGPTGPQGVTGEKGEMGVTGERGPQGVTGQKGEMGVTGERGPQGVTGEKGEMGVTGERGPQGPTGQMGVTGERGPQGVTGEKGMKGDTPNAITVKTMDNSFQSIPNSLLTDVNLVSTVWNIGGFTVGVRSITIPKTTRYHITINYLWTLGSAAGTVRTLSLRNNGSSILIDDAIYDAISGRSVPLSSNNAIYRSISGSFSLTAGDSIDMEVQQNSGGAINLSGTQLVITEIV